MKNTLFSKHTFFVLILVFFIVLAASGLSDAVFAEDGDGVTVDNGIPIVYIDIDESRGTIEDMITSPDHSVYCYGTIRIDVPDGFSYSDFPDIACEDLSAIGMEIRGRGNSSWESAKKPYKIKLDKKREVLGLGKNKHWVLVANAYDRTLIRDRITAWLGDKMGFEFTPTGYPVDVVMSGEIGRAHV